MSVSAVKPPLWVWPARLAGLSALLLGLLLPGGYLWWRSVVAMPTEQLVEVKDLRPTMMLLPVGTFQMGSAEDDSSAFPDEQPRHQVEITQRFAISETEVTQAQYLAVMKENPSTFKDRDDWKKRPVEGVSWRGAIEYCNRLSVAVGLEQCYQVQGEKVTWTKGLGCRGYRLPTEAEWEYAARSDEGTQYAGSNQADEVAWFGEGPEKGGTHEVRGKKSNQWGLYDLSGNVWEWVWDSYDAYRAGSQKNPVGPLLGGHDPVIRGGYWANEAQSVRVADRGGHSPGARFQRVGLRLARSYP